MRALPCWDGRESASRRLSWHASWADGLARRSATAKDQTPKKPSGGGSPARTQRVAPCQNPLYGPLRALWWWAASRSSGGRWDKKIDRSLKAGAIPSACLIFRARAWHREGAWGDCATIPVEAPPQIFPAKHFGPWRTCSGAPEGCPCGARTCDCRRRKSIWTAPHRAPESVPLLPLG